MSPDEAAFVDRMGLFFELAGGPRTMGRVYGWLLICDPPQQSLTQLADVLSVSKASVSTAARQLQDGGMVERLPSPTRRHHYRVTPGGFTSVLGTQASRMRLGVEAAEFGLSVLDPNVPSSASACKTFATSANSPPRYSARSSCGCGPSTARTQAAMTGTNRIDCTEVRWGRWSGPTSARCTCGRTKAVYHQPFWVTPAVRVDP